MEQRFDDANTAIVAICDLISDTHEQTELLGYVHATLSAMAEYLAATKSSELSLGEQLIRGNAGPMAETHLRILHQLLESGDCDKQDILKWLGIRHAEKCDFEQSRLYYKRCYEVSEGVNNTLPSVSDMSRKQASFMSFSRKGSKPPILKPLLIGDDANDKVQEGLKRSITKEALIHFEFFKDDEANRNAERKDFTQFGGVHLSADTVLYSIPNQGWASS